MGYTHYWNSKKSTDADWDKFISVCKQLHTNLPKHSDVVDHNGKAYPINIAGGDGVGKPFFNAYCVWFNGKDGKADLSHETFCIERATRLTFNFCKTARKPYDLLAVACLIAGYLILDYNFDSDGINKNSIPNKCDDLMPAINYYNEVIKPEIPVTAEMIIEQSKYYI
jgi:hypothetical protein